jgi:NTP pyrophosphatase (non-canonical NTP hydrolase)
MATIKIELPDEIAQYQWDIHRFVDQMVHKLWVHRDKGGWDDLDTEEVFMLLQGEVDEVQDAITFGTLHELKDELADVANFCMIYHAVLNRQNPEIELDG